MLEPTELPTRIAIPNYLAAFSLLWIAACAGSVNLGDSRDGGRDGGVRRTGPFDECGNGFDDDADGRIDDGCPCGPGETQACFSGSLGNRGVGACSDGVQTCSTALGIEWGDWGDYPCLGDRRPAAEMCDGMDHDCDGARDEDCPCTAGESRECGVEFLSAPCAGGRQTCGPDGRWSDCDGRVAPMPELCGDLVDNDCDGRLDEKCDCVPTPELCRTGVDEDCDGAIDEPACDPDWPLDGGVPDAGRPRDGGVCTPALGAPRLIAPISTGRVTSKRPALRWERSAASASTRVELCRDPECTRLHEAIETAGETARPSAALPAGPTFWRAAGVGPDGVVGCEWSATWVMFVGHRDAPIDTVSGLVMDSNRDGWPEFVMSGFDVGGAPEAHAMLYSGSAAGFPTAPTHVWTTPRPSRVLAASLEATSAAGDLDGDGFGETILCQTSLDECWIYLGGPTTAGTRSGSIPSRWAFGAGDIDGDGYGDVVVRTPAESTAIWYGGPRPFAGTTVVLDRSHYYAYPAGDTNGDGLGDVLAIVDSPDETIAGRTHIYFGRASRTYGGPDVAIELVRPTRSSNPAHYGNNFAIADVNGDGYTDLLIGESDSIVFPEQIRVHLGGPAGPAPIASASFLARVNPARVGDVDGDGYEDIVAHTSGADAVLLRGSAGGLTEAAVVVTYPGTFTCAFSWAVGHHSGGGDLDGDGYEDYVRSYGEDCGRAPSALAAIHGGGERGLEPSSPPIPIPAGVTVTRIPSSIRGAGAHSPH